MAHSLSEVAAQPFGRALRDTAFASNLWRIFFLALLLRLGFLLEISGQPVLYLVMGDSASYDAWAQNIAAGDWLGSEVFFQAPLYPYVLGALYSLFGRDLFLVRVAQILISALACVLLAVAGRDVINRRAGVFAGALASVYAPSIYFSCLLQKAVFSHFFMSLCLYALGRLAVLPRTRVWLGAGLALGFFALTRENSLIFAPLLLLWPLVGFRERPLRVRLTWMAAAALGLALLLGATAIRNRLVSPPGAAGWHLTTSNLGPTLFIGNNPAATGSYAPLLPGRGDPRYEQADFKALAERSAGRTLTPAEVSSYWIQRTLDFPRAQPFAFAALLWKKWTLFWNATELADTEDLYSYASWSLLLRSLERIFNFGLLVALAAAGAVLTWPTKNSPSALALGWRGLAPLYAAIAAFSSAIVVFFVMDRYRYPITAPLTLLAGGALAALYDAASVRRVPDRCALACGVAACIALFAFLPTTPKAQLMATTRFNVGHGLAARGDYAKAMDWYASSLALFDADPQVHNNAAVALLALGRPAQALHLLDRALTLSPGLAIAQSNRGNALAALGKPELAIAAFAAALELDPSLAKTHANWAAASLQLGRAREAVEHYRAALALDASLTLALDGLARLLATTDDASLKDPAEAVRLAETAARLAPETTHVLETLALAYDAAGRKAEAAIVRLP